MGMAKPIMGAAAKAMGVGAAGELSEQAIRALARKTAAIAGGKQLGVDTLTGTGEQLISTGNQLDTDLTTGKGWTDLLAAVQTPEFAKGVGLESLVNILGAGAQYKGDVKQLGQGR
jgi:hypothetical protein